MSEQHWGYGRSSVPAAPEDYALEPIVQDMLDLLAGLGRESAVWVGHDWGSPVAWSLAAHHPGRVAAVANLCVPYIAAGFTLPNLLPLVDRGLYPEDAFPAGQWDYQYYHLEQPDRVAAVFEADPAATVRAFFRAGNPASRGRPAYTATIRRRGGWFEGADRAPDLPMDPAILDAESFSHYVASLTRNGFRGPNAWYRNQDRNTAYAAGAPGGGRLRMPVLFLHAAHDTTCDTVGSALAAPMRRDCADLTEVVVPSGHWMAQERPEAVNAALAGWLARRVPAAWPG